MMLLSKGRLGQAALFMAVYASFLTNCVQGFFPGVWLASTVGIGAVSHEAQTKKAFEQLAAKYFPEIKSLTRTMLRARDAIAEANMDIDKDQKHAEKHFDGESFEAGQSRLTQLSGEVIDALRAGNGDEARDYLGQALHTLQDFYSHSNWVELGNSDINYALGSSETLSYAAFDQGTCNDCSNIGFVGSCYDCRHNTNGFSLLTSGYYFGEDSPPSGVAIPSHKCHHGGALDNSWHAGVGLALAPALVQPGINKDSSNCFLSPHYTLHFTAAALATKATIQFVEDILAKVNDHRDDDSQKRLLFGVGPTMAFAIDTTNSMSDVIASVREHALEIVNSRLGTPDEPSLYVIAPFNDPTVGPVTATADLDVFKSTISGLVASGGGDCAEPSMSGALEAMKKMRGPADLFLMTDAAPKDPELQSEVVRVAFEKNIKIATFKFDSKCDKDRLRKRGDLQSDQVYASLATDTGGWYHSLPRAEVARISGVLDTSTKSDSTGILKIASRIFADVVYPCKIPIDSAMTEFSISARGDASVESLAGPRGALLDLGSVNVTSTNLTDGQFITVRYPYAGNWLLKLTGNGTFSLDVTGVSSLHFSAFNFVAEEGRPGHTGYFPITGQPAYDQDIAVIGTLDGAFSNASFSLRNPEQLLEIQAEMTAGSGEEGHPPKNSFFGKVRPGHPTLYAYCYGIDAAGFDFQRVWPSLFTPQRPSSTVTGVNTAPAISSSAP